MPVSNPPLQRAQGRLTYLFEWLTPAAVLNEAEKWERGRAACAAFEHEYAAHIHANKQISISNSKVKVVSINLLIYQGHGLDSRSLVYTDGGQNPSDSCSGRGTGRLHQLSNITRMYRYNIKVAHYSDFSVSVPRSHSHRLIRGPGSPG